MLPGIARAETTGMDRTAMTALLRHCRALCAAEDWRGALDALDGRANGDDDEIIALLRQSLRAKISGAHLADDDEPRFLIADALAALRSPSFPYF